MLTLKKGLSILISLILIVLLTACSEVDPNYGVSSESTVSEETVSILEKSNYDKDMKIMSSDRVMSNYFDISLFDEENYADIYLGKDFEIKAEFMGGDLPVPTTLEAVENLGWNLCEGNEYNHKSLVFAYETIKIILKNKDGIKITAYAYNSSRSSITLAECAIVKFRLENDFYIVGENHSAFNINGISNNLAITDIIETLGTPSHFYAVTEEGDYYLDYFITKEDRRNGITVFINTETDAITAIEFSYYK